MWAFTLVCGVMSLLLTGLWTDQRSARTEDRRRSEVQEAQLLRIEQRVSRIEGWIEWRQQSPNPMR